MKKMIIGIMIACIFLATTVSYAAQDASCASEKARENASDQAVFNRVGDWFATVGKSDEEREQIITERRVRREAKRAEKEARKAERQLKEKAGDAEKTLGKAAKKGKKDGKKMKDSMMKGPQK